MYVPNNLPKLELVWYTCMGRRIFYPLPQDAQNSNFPYLPRRINECRRYSEMISAFVDNKLLTFNCLFLIALNNMIKAILPLNWLIESELEAEK